MAETFASIADMVKEAEKHADETSADRLRAIQYYQGEMKDTPAEDSKSKMVTRDVRAQIKKVLPSIMRTILGADEVTEYLPVGEGDEEGAAQASDYVNFIILPECNGKQAIYDAVHDALLLRNGILKWWYDEKQAVQISKHSGLTEDALAQLVEPDEITVIEHDERIEVVETEQGAIQIPLHDVKIRRTYRESQIRAAAVPRDRFLIHPDAVTLQDSLLTGEKDRLTRSDLVSMGYDRALIDDLAQADEDDTEDDARRDVALDGDESTRANELVDYYDLYIRIDLDGDGIAELRHMTFAGGLTEKHLLENDEVDEIQLCDLSVMRQPHQWEGISLADDLMDIQQIKTVLLRQTADNLYWQNMPQPIAQKSAIEDMDAVYNPEFGLPIVVKAGIDVRSAYGFSQVPFVAKESFGMLEYMDQEAQDRTGVSDASSGLAPDALQNMTAKASAMIEQAGIGQTEMMVKNVADGLRTFFRGILRLCIRHQDVARTVRLRDEWVTVDPRHWNADMDCTVNTGLGAGTRERDMQMMQLVMGMQEKILAAFGPDNPFVKPDNLFNSAVKMIESAGLRTPSMYITEPDPAEVQQRLEAMRNQKPPEQMKLEAQMQLEQQKMQTNAAKEKAQMDADLMVKQAEIAAGQQKQADQLAANAALQEQKLAWEREKFAAEQALKREDMAAKREDARAKRQDDIWKHQAANMTPEKEAAHD